MSGPEGTDKCEEKGLSNVYIDTMKLLKFFSKIPIIDELGMKPSLYLNELMLPFKERLPQLNKNTDLAQLFEDAPLKAVYDRWDVRPRFVFFNNWEPLKEYEAVFTVRNKYRNSKQLNVRMEKNEVFTVERMTQMMRVASMVTVSFKVRFTPREYTDYLHRAIITTETETFHIYVVGIAPRPLINFPDRIDFGESLVRYSNEKIINLKNIGKISAAVNFQTIGKVTLKEDRITLNPDEECSLKMILEAEELGMINGQIIATYESGERIYMNVTADCQEGKILVEKYKVHLEKTYIGLKSTQTLRVKNLTGKLVNFHWLRTEDIRADKAILKRMSINLSELMGLNKTNLREKQHTSILDRIFEDETENAKHRFYFIDSCIHITPNQGKMWPNTEVIFVITFMPTIAVPHVTESFLEVEGLLERIRVVFEGEAIGPNIALNVATIDFGRIFICTAHTYVVMAKNIGHVKGTLRYTPSDLLCGGEISCEPEELTLLPDETKFIEIKISSTIAGHFVEDVHFEINESKEEQKLTIKGEIINPRLKSDKPLIDFGNIALGIPVTEKLCLKNDSPIPIEVVINVEGDGTMPVVRIDSGDLDLILPENPREFRVSPDVAVIQSGDNLEVEVTVISNKIRSHKTLLNIYIWGVLVDESSVVLKYTSMIPKVVINPSEIVMRYAFTGYEYCHKLIVCNESNLPAYFYILPQEESYNPYILYHIENGEGFLKELSCQMVYVYIKVLSLKPCKEKIRAKLFGLNHTQQACIIKAYGMGPVVNPSMFNINWGKIPIMVPIEKRFELINVSPIPAYYKVDFMKRGDVWSVNHNHGTIHPDNSEELVLTAKVLDNGPITDKLWVEITGSRDIHIHLSACGEGISIFTEPNIFPLYDIGTVFRKEKQDKIIKIRNVGTKHHTLLFTTSNDLKNMTKMTAEKEQGKYFKLNPYRLDLPGGTEENIVLSYKWNEEAVLEDTYYCCGTVNNEGKRIIFATSTIRATFTDPQFFTDPSEVNFRTDVSELDTVIEPLYQAMTINSQWNTKLAVECKVTSPFRFGFVSNKDGNQLVQSFELEPGIAYPLDLFFDPPNLSSRRTKVIRDVLTVSFIGHTVKAHINLTAEINFPNVSISTKLIDFGCIIPGGEGIYQTQIRNVSPLTVNFEWFWEGKNSTHLKVPNEQKSEGEFISKLLQMEHDTEEDCIIDLDDELPNAKKYFDKPPVTEKMHSKAEHQSFYRNLLSEKYYSEDGKVPQNLEVLITELLAVKYEYEKMKEDPGIIKKRDYKIDWENQFVSMKSTIAPEIPLTKTTLKENLLSALQRQGLFDSMVSLESPHDTDSSYGIFEGMKQILGLDSTTSSIDKQPEDQFVDLISQLPYDMLSEDVTSNIKKCLKKDQDTDSSRSEENTPEICKVIDISPCRDVLEPKECLMMTFTFKPSRPIWIEATANCQIRGGPSEHLDFVACSYPIFYEVFPKIINFGIGPFCEVWCSFILIWNKSLKDINVSASIPNSLNFKGDSEFSKILPMSVCIHPRTKTVKPFELSFHQVLIYPGHIGEVDQLILVEVDNKEPTHINFVGYAMPNQIHLSIPHVIKIESPEVNESMYHAIARLTSKWFEHDIKDLTKGSISHEELDVLLQEIKARYQEGDWDLLMDRTDIVPAIDDMNLAYERFLCEQFSKMFENQIPHHSPIQKGLEVLHGLIFPSYVVDFGLIIDGTKASYSVRYSNYSPTKTEIKITYPNDTNLVLERFGVTFKPHLTQILKPYEGRHFDITMRPAKDVFVDEQFECQMSFDFQILVTCGGIIPVTVKALITYPVVIAPQCIEFGGVKVGYRRTIQFKLENISQVNCEWISLLTTSNKPVYYLDRKTKAKPKNCPFFVKPVYGFLKPYEQIEIEVVFEPQHEIPYEVDINILVNMSSKIKKVRIRGYGIEAKLLIRDVDFGYSIPYSVPLTRRLTIYNPSLYPLEVFINEEDKQNSVETTFFTYLLTYFKNHKICVPSWFFDNHASDEMWAIFKKLALSAIQKHVRDTSTFFNVLVKQRLMKGKGFSSSDSSGVSTSTAKTKAKKNQAMKSLLRLQNGQQKSREKESRLIKGLISTSRQSIPAPSKIDLLDSILLKETRISPLADIIKEYIDSTNDYGCPRIDFTEVLKTIEFREENKWKEGTIIMIHSSPSSYPSTFAMLMEKHVGAKAVNIDKIIYDDIKEGESVESLIIKDLLYSFYLEEKALINRIYHDVNGRAAEYEKYNFPIKTLKVLIKFATKAFFNKSGSEDIMKIMKSNENTSYSSPTLLGIPKEYFGNIILRRLHKKLPNGIIIKRLNSIFFSTATETLLFLLNIFKMYKNVHVISLYTSVEQRLRLNKNLINTEIIDFFYKLTGKDILEASPSYIRKVGEEFFDQKKVLSKARIGSSGINLKTKVFRSSQSYNAGIQKERSLKLKPSKIFNTLENEFKFGYYLQELQNIGQILEYYERMPPVMGNESFASSNSLKTKSKKSEFSIIKKITSAFTKADIKVEENIGFPLWILYNYPYTHDYQFSLFPEWLTNLSILKQDTLTADINTRDLYVCNSMSRIDTTQTPLTGKSYFILDNVSHGRGANIYRDSTTEDVFMLSPVIKRKPKKKNKKLSSAHDQSGLVSVDKHSSKEKFITRSEAVLVPSLQKTTDNLAFIQSKVEMYCSLLEKHLLKEFNGIFDNHASNKLTRQLVMPSRFVSWDVHFSPAGCCDYVQCIPFGISGCRTVKCVQIFAGCDIPDILFDPYFMFSEVQTDDIELENVFSQCYLLSKDLFHFGMIITQPGAVNGGNFSSMCPVKIRNTSNIPVNIMITLVHEEKLKSFLPELSFSSRTSSGNLSKRKNHSVLQKTIRKSKMNVSRISSNKKNNRGTKSHKLSPVEKTFYCDLSELFIPVGETRTLNIFSSPTKTGVNTEMLLFSIENNPKVYALKVACYGITARVEFRPMELVFEEVVLYRTLTKCLLIDNVSKVPLLWKVMFPEFLQPFIVLSKYEGLINPLGQDAISVTYQANSVERITKDLSIGIYSPLDEYFELQRHTYKIVLRSYSVDVNVHFEESGDNHLVLGSIGMVESINTKLMVENCGSHPITYNLMINNEELSSLKENFLVVCKNDILSIRPKETYGIELSISYSGEIKMTKVPFIIIDIFDYASEELIAKIPSYISVQSFFPEFILRPAQTLNFGDLEVGSVMSLDIVLENTGFIPFSFKITPERMTSDFKTVLDLLLYPLSRSRNIDTKKGRASDTIFGKLNNIAFLKKVLVLNSLKLFAAKVFEKLNLQFDYISKKSLNYLIALQNKLKMRLNVQKRRKLFLKSLKSRLKNLPNLDSDDMSSNCTSLLHDGPASQKYESFISPPFEIKPSDGEVQVGEYVVCTVYCCPMYEGSFRKRFNLYVHNAHPEDCEASIELIVNCSLPKVNFEDYSFLFNEFEIIDKWLPRLHSYNEGFPYGVFCSSEKLIKLCNVIVGSSATFNIYLKSENHLPSTILVSVIGDQAFEVNGSLTWKCPIAPYEVCFVSLTFCPSDLLVYESIIEFSLLSVNNFKLQTCSFLISGNGNIPIGSIEKNIPFNESTHNISNDNKIDFGFVHLNNSASEFFSIRNVGLVVCDFWLEMHQKSSCFILKHVKESNKADIDKTNNKVSESFNSTKIFRTKPEECITFEVIFSPTEIGVFSVQVLVQILHNPYESTYLKVVGNCFQSEIVIRGLPCNMALSSLIPKSGNPLEYLLDFGSCAIGERLKKTFIIQNNSLHIVRFEIILEGSQSEVIFIPSIGHIFGSSRKEVTAFLIASNSLLLKVSISLSHNAIVYKDEMISVKEWDNSAKIIHRLEEKKIYLDMGEMNQLPVTKNQIIEEPSHSMISYVAGDIYILATAITDIPVLEISTTDLVFPPVLVGHVNSLTFTIANKGNVDACFELSLVNEVWNPTCTYEVNDIAFGKLSYNLRHLSDLDYEKCDSSLESYWPQNLPADLELVEYQQIFASLESEENLEKYEYLRNNYISATNGKPVPNKSMAKVKREYTLDQYHPSEYSCKYIDDSEVSSGEILGSNNEYVENPFWTDIRSCSLKPNERVGVKVSFLPDDIKGYKAYVRVSTKSESSFNNVINITGRGFVPLCHIEIEEDDYLSFNEISLRKVHYSTRVILITCFSPDAVIKRTFNVYNTSELPYNFKWYCLKNSSNDKKLSCFTPTGIIYPHDKGEMLFSFCSIEYGVFESLWLLCIKEFTLLQPILFVGITKVPEVNLEPFFLTIEPTFLGKKISSEVKLVNLENVSVEFSIMENSFANYPGLQECFSFTPMKGKILPKSAEKLIVQYVPQKERVLSFCINISIDSFKNVISLTVNIQKFSIAPLIYCEKENYEKIYLNCTDEENPATVSIGNVVLQVPYKLQFTVDNLGDIPIHFECPIPQKDNRVLIEIDALSGLVLPNKQSLFTVEVTANQKISFQQLFCIKISQGPILNVLICGNAVTPLFDFSFDSYDFGVCVVQKYEELLHTVVLEFFNKDNDPCLLEAQDCMEAFSMNFSSLLVDPRSVHKITIAFNPLEAKKYRETQVFLIAGKFEHHISLSGEGDFFHVGIVNPEDFLVDFGLVKAGTVSTREVSLVNKTRAIVNFALFEQERLENITNVKLDVKYDRKPLKLNPDEIFVVQICFYSRERVKDFCSAVMYKAYGEKNVLFYVKAVAIGYEISVDQNALLFGPTTIGCMSTLKFALMNTGDIGTMFKLESSLLSEAFVVKPSAGYSSPGSTVIIEVTFLPNTPMQYHNNMLICLLNNYHPLTINITGVGVQFPSPLSTVNFTTEVRKKVKKIIPLDNSSRVPQTVYPVIEGEHFFGLKSITIPPQEKASYEITYHPFTQTLHHFHFVKILQFLFNWFKFLYYSL